MDNQGNRLYLNIANTGASATSRPDRAAYPTTPSTFPQPVYPPTANQQASGMHMQQHQQQQQPYGYAPQGYFNPNQQQQHQHQQQYQPMPTHHQDFAQGYGQARSNTPGASNDPNTGLAHQFSHQNLGGAARSGGYGSRGPSPAGSQRPRTAGGSGQAHNYSYLNAPMPSGPKGGIAGDFEVAPERNPDKFGPNANNNQKKCSQLAADFFKDSVKRARERNQR
jgi:protein-serine/threonine kinase